MVMPILFIVALVVFAIALLSGAYWAVSREPEGGAYFVGALILGIALTFGASANSVPVRNVGIVTSFNKPIGEVTGSGLQWVKPWQKVGEWDASRQRYDHASGKNAIPVRTGTLADASVQVLIEWQVKQDSNGTADEVAAKQYKDYKGDFETFRNQRVGIQLDGAMNDAFSTYVPLANIDSKTGNLNVDLKPFADKVKTYAIQRLGNDVDILSVTVIRVNHDQKTEENIKAFQDKLAQGRNLEQDQKNANLQKSVSETNAKVDKQTRCMEIAEKVGSNPGLCLNPGIVVGSK
jgi:hypothetical protein